jgi:hypothetical protein
MTEAEWMKKGKELFGEDMLKWRFVCPGCGCIQSVEDFRQYKDKGADPSSAYCECLGRYIGGSSWMYDKRKKGVRCDYAGYGLLRISPVTVIDDDGKEIKCFAFDEGEKTNGK